MLTSIEICAGAGGQALGLSLAGFTHVALVEYEKDYCSNNYTILYYWYIFKHSEM